MAAQLASALKVAKGGETFDLAPGNYGALLIQSRRFSTPVTFRSIDPSKPAVFSGQSVVRVSSGVRFDAVSFHMPSPVPVQATEISPTPCRQTLCEYVQTSVLTVSLQ